MFAVHTSLKNLLEVPKEGINRTYDPNQANRGFTENPPPPNTGTKPVQNGPGGGNTGVPNQAGGLGTGNPAQNNHRDTQKVTKTIICYQN